jgi:hypothetical protein
MDTTTRIRHPAWMLVVLLAGCREPSGNDGRSAAPAGPAAPIQATAPVPGPSSAASSASADWVSLRPVTGMHLIRDFDRSNLMGARWKADAGADDMGTPLLALVMDGSNEVTAAELRIGRSDDPGAVADCETVPEYADPADGEVVEVDGIPFRRFAWADAGMSHYMEVEAYRAVRGGQCLAIDLLVTGTRPEVYDPPRQPPFQRDEARQRLSKALAAVKLDH